MNSGKDAKKLFGRRLREIMLQRGHGSEGARSGVDIGKLAEAAATSYEMARRYAEGVAIPRPDKLRAIAEWLRVSPGALAWGETGSAVDERLLQECLNAVLEAQKRTGKTLTTERSSHLVAVLYQEAASGRFPEKDTIDLLLRAV